MKRLHCLLYSTYAGLDCSLGLDLDLQIKTFFTLQRVCGISPRYIP